MGLRESARREWQEGAKHGFPPCCRAQFIADQAAFDLVMRVPGVTTGKVYRVRKLLDPRYAIADGFVPCTYHALKWGLTGTKAVSRERRKQGDAARGYCCREMKRAIADRGVIVERIPVEVWSGTARIWVLRHADDPVEGRFVHIRRCPWCGRVPQKPETP